MERGTGASWGTGSAEFIHAFNTAIASKISPPADALGGLLTRYQQSDDYRRLAERTRKDYAKNISVIERKFRDFPITALSDRRTRSVFLAWRDELATRSPRQADYVMATLVAILAWGLDRGLVTHNPCERPGRAYRGSRVDKIWSDADEQAFYAAAPKKLHLPMTLAVGTAQRQGDLLRLPWSAYDGRTIKLRQGKTGMAVAIPVSSALKRALDAEPRICPVILTNTESRQWKETAFRKAWRAACRKAGIEGLTFHDLRGTAVTRLAIAGVTQAEIAAFTGHSLSDVHAILDRHYLSRDPVLAENAVAKLEANRLPNC